MQLTGRNLAMVKRGIELAIDELHNQVATCPDVNHYAREIEELEAEKRKFEQLLRRVDRALERNKT